MIRSAAESVLSSPATVATPARIRETAEGFEALFLGLLLEPMEKAGAAFFGEGAAGRAFGGLFRTQIAAQLAKTRPLGIADRVELSLAARGELPEPTTER